MGLTVNIANTKYMSLGTDANHLELDNGDVITGCTEFRYLVSIFTKDGRDTKNIRHRVTQARKINKCINPYPTAFPYGNGMVLHFYQQQESSTTKTVHKVINKGLKAYV